MTTVLTLPSHMTGFLHQLGTGQSGIYRCCQISLTEMFALSMLKACYWFWEIVWPGFSNKTLLFPLPQPLLFATQKKCFLFVVQFNKSFLNRTFKKRFCKGKVPKHRKYCKKCLIGWSLCAILVWSGLSAEVWKWYGVTSFQASNIKNRRFIYLDLFELISLVDQIAMTIE